MKRIIPFFIVFLISFSCLSQEAIDTMEIFITSKLIYMVENQSLYNISAVQLCLDEDNVSFLSSKGFDNYYFIKIQIRNAFPENFELDPETSKDALTKNRIPFNCDYILAFNKINSRFYKLKGFKENEFISLWEKPPRKKDKERILKDCWISELDIECLFDAHFSRKKDLSNFECLRSCQERDDEGFVF